MQEPQTFRSLPETARLEITQGLAPCLPRHEGPMAGGGAKVTTKRGLHQCALVGCDNWLSTGAMLMCYEHWRLVPKALQVELYQHWHRGNPTSSYREVRKAAIAAVGEVRV